MCVCGEAINARAVASSLKALARGRNESVGAVRDQDVKSCIGSHSGSIILTQMDHPRFKDRVLLQSPGFCNAIWGGLKHVATLLSQTPVCWADRYVPPH